MKKITLLILLMAFQIGVFAQVRFEAEDATTDAVAQDAGWRMTNPSGGQAAYFTNAQGGAYLEWTVNEVPSAASYDLTFAYSTAGGANQCKLFVNGVEIETIAWTATGALTTTASYNTSVALNSGDNNTIRIVHDWGWMAVDYMEVSGNGLSVDDFALNAIKMYPNPTNGMLNFDNLKEIQNIEVMDVTGKAVRFVKNQNYIDINSLDAGVYLVRIGLPNDQSVMRKVIKK